MASLQATLADCVQREATAEADLKVGEGVLAEVLAVEGVFAGEEGRLIDMDVGAET